MPEEDPPQPPPEAPPEEPKEDPEMIVNANDGVERIKSIWHQTQKVPPQVRQHMRKTF